MHFLPPKTGNFGIQKTGNLILVVQSETDYELFSSVVHFLIEQ